MSYVGADKTGKLIKYNTQYKNLLVCMYVYMWVSRLFSLSTGQTYHIWPRDEIPRENYHKHNFMYACLYVWLYVRTYVRMYVCMYVCMYNQIRSPVPR